MMNVLAICLLITSLASAGVWSPTPEKQNQRDDDVIVKEGHRVVVVEYDKDTKVLISPQEPDGKGYVSTAKEKLSEAATEKAKEASSVFPNLGQGVSVSSDSHPNGHSHGARELVCDALGTCKHKLASALGKTKEAVSEKAHQVSDKVSEIGEETAGAVGEAFGKAKDTVAGKAHVVEEGAREVAQMAKSRAIDAVDISKTLKMDIEGNLTNAAETVEEKIGEKAGQIGEKAEAVKGKIGEKAGRIGEAVKGKFGDKTEAEKNLSDILRRGREVVYDALVYLWAGPVDWLIGVVHLFGFTTAYGMSMWVTFVSSYILAEALPRQQFGVVQGKIYPVYFRAMAFSVGAVLLAHLLGKRSGARLRCCRVLIYLPRF